MSDRMKSKRISVRVGADLQERLRRRAILLHKDESDIVRDALERLLADPGSGRSALDLAREAGLVGYVPSAPRDLSTNRRHFKGFGEHR